jgi:hypothetical protein
MPTAGVVALDVRSPGVRQQPADAGQRQRDDARGGEQAHCEEDEIRRGEASDHPPDKPGPPTPTTGLVDEDRQRSLTVRGRWERHHDQLFTISMEA